VEKITKTASNIELIIFLITVSDLILSIDGRFGGILGDLRWLIRDNNA